MIGVFPNTLKDPTLHITQQVCHFFKQRHMAVACEDLIASAVGAHPLSTIDPLSLTFRISLGGDGTILRLIHQYPHLTAPLLGINLGSLGFLADVPLQDLEVSLTDLCNGHYRVQRRMMLSGETSHGEHCQAVNEIVLHRAHNPSLIDLTVSVDDCLLNTFAADGLIVSTPTGSTAYSLAAGGPILTPELDAIIITPICPHTISNRPIVLKPHQFIEIRYLTKRLPIEISYDGIFSFSLPPQGTLTLSISNQHFPLVHLNRYDYFSTLREKLGWQGRLKN